MAASGQAATVLVEAESFAEHGGWSLDTQFIREMGSPYLLAHGLGTPVADATTAVRIPAAGTYHAWVRTKDWVARWQAPGTPGKFQVLVNGKPLETTFGTEGAAWGWQAGGTVSLPAHDFHGQWFWESGFDKDPLGDAEGIRDWNLRAVYGAFNAMKNGDGAAKHPNAVLTWVAFVGGPRESRRILGDVVLTQDDIVTKREFPDGCVPSTWSIDLHYPKEQYARKFPDNPFISIAVHDRRVDRDYGYPVPYRCFYSKDIENLFMAGRCISVTHEALGTVRVMKTCGMMGEVVGKAASVVVKHGTTPRGVYENHWAEMDELLKLPGKARQATLADPIEIPADAQPADS